MKKSKQTKRALIPSLLAVILCAAMLVGTTFAWFTDTASTSVNKIEAGKLDVKLEYASNATGEGATWKEVTADTVLSFLQSDGAEVKPSETILWEPGCTYQLPALRISNNGNLALKYKIEITGIQGSAKLNDVIDWTIKNDADSGETNLSTTEYHLTAKGTDNASDILTIKGHMQTTAGNEYQGESISGIAITVLATQDTVEYDSTTNLYDSKAAYDGYVTPVNSESTAVEVTDGNKVVADEAGVMSVDYTDVQLISDESKTQSLEYKGATLSSEAQSITVDANYQAVAQYKLTLPVADTNTTLVTVTINYTKNLTGVKIYHSGKELTKKDAADSSATSEYFTYDKERGTLVLYLFHASPIDIVYDKAGMATVTNQNELVAALADETVKTIVLGSDVTTDTIGNITRSVTIDLNSKTLTYTGGNQIGVKNSGTNFVLKNGSFEERGELKETRGVIINYENTTTTLDHVTATTDATLLYPYKDASTVTVKHSDITSGTYGVGTNNGEGTKVNIKVNIEDSKITTGYGTADTKTDNCAVIMNVGGTLNITGSTITGDRQGVFLRAGTATIKDSIIKTTGAFGKDTYGKNQSQTFPTYWGSGNEAPRGALIVGSYTNGTTYAHDAICYLTNTTLVADGDAKQVHLAGNGANSDTNKFCAKVYTDADTSGYTIDKSWGGTIYVGSETDKKINFPLKTAKNPPGSSRWISAMRLKRCADA